MNPSQEAILWIRSYVDSLQGGWSGLSNQEIVSAANELTVTNPVSPELVPVPFTEDQILGEISDAAGVAILQQPALPMIMEAIESNDIPSCLRWIAWLAKAQILSAAEAQALQAVVTATQDDPTWKPQIGAAQANIGRPLDLDDVSKARPA